VSAAARRDPRPCLAPDALVGVAPPPGGGVVQVARVHGR